MSSSSPPRQALEPGDVLLMNTNGPAVGTMIAFYSPAGQLGMTHVAMMYEKAPTLGKGPGAGAGG